MAIPFPSRTEQRHVAEQVESGTRAFTEGVSQLEREIALLREYRTRLVADVVTGKLDVSRAATRLPNEELLPDLCAADDDPDDLLIEEEADA